VPTVPVDLRVESLTVSYPDFDERVQPLQDLSFSAHDGEVVVVLGPSGCGKTTLLSVLAGLLTPDSGTVSIAGRDVATMSRRELLDHRRHTVGIVFQAFNLVPSLSAVENVMSPLLLTGVSTRVARRRAMELLDEVGLVAQARRKPGRLSGGQQQRVAFARALAGRPALLLADEPTAHLDPEQVDTVLRLIADQRREGRVVVVATHDARFEEVADTFVRLGRHDATTPPPQVVRQRDGHESPSPRPDRPRGQRSGQEVGP
jgi:putative ABC transport system ATP-binding protein